MFSSDYWRKIYIDWMVMTRLMCIIGERQSIVLMTLFGFWAALPWVSFQSKAYEFLTRYVSEDFVGLIMFAVGMLHWIFLLTSHTGNDNKWYKVSVCIRSVFLLLESMLWVMFAVVALISYPASWGFVAYSWFAWGSMKSFLCFDPDTSNLVVKRV